MPEDLQKFPYEAAGGDEETEREERNLPGVVRQEQDVMRDLLDNVSTTATRASSIAGSLLDLESRAGSVTGETARALNYSFSEPGKDCHMSHMSLCHFVTFISFIH